VDNRIEGFRKSGPGYAQFFPVHNRKTMQQSFTARGQLYEHFTMILVSMPTPHGALVDETIDQLHRTVMAKAEPLRESGYGRANPSRQTLDCQKQLMLLGLYALGTGGFLAEMQELADTVTELSESAEASLGKVGVGRFPAAVILTSIHWRRPVS